MHWPECGARYQTATLQDHRIFHHVNSIVTPANLVIRTRDSDLIVMALGIFHNLQNDLNLWLEIGSFTDNSLEYVNVNELYMLLGSITSLSYIYR